jgi:magnesium transporter
MTNIRSSHLFVPEIRQLLSLQKWDELKDVLGHINPIDLADGLPELPPEHQVMTLRLLKPRQLIAVFEELELPEQQYILHHLQDESVSPWLPGAAPEVIEKLCTRLSKQTAKRLSRVLERERVDLERGGFESAPQTAGALMSTGFVPVGADMTAQATLDRLRANLRVRRVHGVDALYATNENGVLVGSVTLPTLVAAPSEIKIKDLMTPVALIKIPASMDQEDAAKIFQRYQLSSAPVVDDDNRLVGVLSANEMLRVVQQEATEDIQKLAAVEALDEPYFKIAFRRMIRKRATWLCALFFGELLTATAMGFFENEISKAVVLALFIPLIISSGGNSGSQASTLIVRALALKEVSLADWWRVMRREFAAGLTLGLILGVIGFTRIVVWAQFSDIYGPNYMALGLTVGCALILIVLWGSLSGSLLPILLRRLGLDPATASAPAVATLVDVTGLVIYFLTAVVFMRGSLL